MSSSEAKRQEVQDQIAQFQSILSDNDLTEQEQIQVEDAILALNRQLSALRRQATTRIAAIVSRSHSYLC